MLLYYGVQYVLTWFNILASDMYALTSRTPYRLEYTVFEANKWNCAKPKSIQMTYSLFIYTVLLKFIKFIKFY